MADEQRYRMTYDIEIHPEGVPRSEIDDDEGACDSLLLCSVVGEFGVGEISYLWVSNNGHEDRDMTPEEIFQCWVVLARQLAHTLPEGSALGVVARLCFDVVRDNVLASKEDAQ